MKRLLNIALFAIYMIIKVISLVDGGGDGSDNSSTSEHGGEVRQLDMGATLSEPEDQDVLSGVFTLDPKANSNIVDALSRGIRSKGPEFGLSRGEIQGLIQSFEYLRSLREEKRLAFTQDGRFTLQTFMPFSRQPKLSGTWTKIGDGLFSLKVDRLDAEHLQADKREEILQNLSLIQAVIQRDGDHLLLLDIPQQNHPSPEESVYAIAMGLQLDPKEVATRFIPESKLHQFSQVTIEDIQGQFVMDVKAKESSRLEMKSRLDALRNRLLVLPSTSEGKDDFQRALLFDEVFRQWIEEVYKQEVGDVHEVATRLWAQPAPVGVKSRLELQVNPQVFNLSYAAPFQPEQIVSGSWSVEEGLIRFVFDDQTEESRVLASEPAFMGGCLIDGDVYILLLPSSNPDYYSLEPSSLAELLELDVFHLATKYKRE